MSYEMWLCFPPVIPMISRELSSSPSHFVFKNSHIVSDLWLRLVLSTGKHFHYFWSCWSRLAVQSFSFVPAPYCSAIICTKYAFCFILIQSFAEGHLLGNHFSVEKPNYSLFVRKRKWYYIWIMNGLQNSLQMRNMKIVKGSAYWQLNENS